MPYIYQAGVRSRKKRKKSKKGQTLVAGFVRIRMPWSAIRNARLQRNAPNASVGNDHGSSQTLSRHQMSVEPFPPHPSPLPNRRQCTESFLRGGEGTNRRAHERLSSRSEKNNQEKC